MVKLNKKVFFVLFLFIFIVFCYFRLKPILLQTVPYTYDQGRDFLKANQIINEKKLTFIGPTTGIDGLFHGAWWYYFLLIPYILFNGWPQGFYLAVFFLNLTSTLLFFLFIKREMGIKAAIFFLATVSISPYFTRLGFFTANNILTPGFVLLFIFSLYKFIQTTNYKYLFTLSLAIGFIFESEVSFGLYLIPAFVITALFFKEFRSAVTKSRSLITFLFGLTIPFFPRILFEIKNNFLQTRSILNFITNPSATNAQSYTGAIRERVKLFLNYNNEIFYINSMQLTILFILIYFIIYNFREIEKYRQKIIIFLVSITILLFGFSLVGKNNFLWSNYLEGLQYVFLFIMILGLNSLLKVKNIANFIHIIFVSLIIINVLALNKEISNKQTPSLGLRADRQTIEYIYKKAGKNDFCLRIYTPPVIPFTYNYLIAYKTRTQGYKWPKNEYVNNRCWYIFDQEPYYFRIINWRKDNIPNNAKIIKSETMKNGTLIELWKL